ncbi:MAG TPA: endo alpha-1,4 polygalactosaminidase [Polyangiaceae bacterium]
MGVDCGHHAQSDPRPHRLRRAGNPGILRWREQPGLNEECQEWDECEPLAEYVRRGKLALNTEYAVALDCATSDRLNINSIRKDLSLVGARDSGYRYQFCP